MDLLSSNLRYWLVKHPAISQFEWKHGQTLGASPLFVAAAVLSYLSAVAILSLRHNPKPLLDQRLLRRISAVHNLFLLLLSLTMAVGCTLSVLAQMPRPHWILCFPANRTRPRGPVFFWAHVYYLSRILEFADTLLILLSRSRRLTFLHVYHHAAVVVMSYLWLEAAQSLVPVALVTNTAVHVVMYGYYLLCAVGRRPAWKRAVTDLQIGQFVFSFAVSGGMLYLHATEDGGGCSGFYAWCFNAVFNASLLALFLNFHASNYSSGKKRAD